MTIKGNVIAEPDTFEQESYNNSVSISQSVSASQSVLATEGSHVTVSPEVGDNDTPAVPVP